MNIKRTILILLLFQISLGFAQNSMTGDGFGGRLWYKPYNYSVGSYSGYTVCGDSFQLYCWGQNQYGQLGNGQLSNSKTPVKAIGMTNVKFYTCGYIMAAIKCDSTGWIWGKGTPNQLFPLPVLNSVRFGDAGSHATSFVKYDGTVWTVGLNSHGEFGNGSTSAFYTTTPEQMNNITTAVRVANGFNTITVLLSNGRVKVCGSNIYGGLGNNSSKTTIATNPVNIDSLKGIIDIKANDFTIIALDSSGDVYQWGKKLTSSQFDSVPKKIKQLKNIVAISGCDDGDNFLALDSNKNCFGWGLKRNTFGGGTGSLGLDTPVLVATDVADILAGELFSYIVKSDGSLWASGTSIPIWMNLTDSIRNVFTKLEPTGAPMYLCGALPFRQPFQVHDSIYICSDDSVEIKNKFYKPNTIFRDTILGGACSLDTFKAIQIIPIGLFIQNKTICRGDTFKVGIHKYTQTGNFTDTLMSKKGCDSIVITNLVVNDPSFFTQKTVLCSGDSVVFNNSTYKIQGSYTAILMNSKGCDSVITLNLEVNNLSYFTQNVTLCHKDTFRFNNKAYFLNGMYSDTLKNQVNCDSIVTTNLNVINPSITNQRFRICEYETIKVGNNSYNKPGDYADTLKTSGGCDSIVNTNIYVKNVPVINIQDTSLCENFNEIIHLNAGNYKSYFWLPNGEFTNEITVTKAGVYKIVITAFDSCTATDSVIVINNCPPHVLIPNVFTINNDNLNDAYDIEIEGETEYKLRIFNRWGELVYQSETDGLDNDGINWNGRLHNNGAECHEGIYYMFFTYKFRDGKSRSHKGEVTLIRGK